MNSEHILCGRLWLDQATRFELQHPGHAVGEITRVRDNNQSHIFFPIQFDQQLSQLPGGSLVKRTGRFIRSASCGARSRAGPFPMIVS